MLATIADMVLSAQAPAARVYALASKPAGGAAGWLVGRADGLHQTLADGQLTPFEGFPLGDAAVTALLVHDDRIYAAVPGGILTGTHGSWRPTPLATAPTVSALCGSLRRAELLFAATLGDGVLCSADAGASWAAWNFGLVDPTVLALGVAQVGDDELLFAGTESGLFCSVTEGRSWVELALPFTAPVTAVAACGAMLLVGGEGSGLWRCALADATAPTTSRADGWQQIEAGRLDSLIAVTVLSVGNQHALIAATPQQLLISRDGLDWLVAKTAPLDAVCTCLGAITTVDGSLSIAFGTENSGLVSLRLGLPL